MVLDVEVEVRGRKSLLEVTFVTFEQSPESDLENCLGLWPGTHHSARG